MSEENITLDNKIIYKIEVPKYNAKMYCFLGDERNYREENYSDIELVGINRKDFNLYYMMTSCMYYKAENCYTSKKKAEDEEYKRKNKYYSKLGDE